MAMFKFTSIDAIRNVWHHVQKYGTVGNYPVVEYTGTVKLHGSNGGVFYDSVADTITPQSRTNELSIGKDNAGFAVFCAGSADMLKAAANLALLVADTKGLNYNVTLFGEWCGGNIQNMGELGLRQCPKHFVIFDVLFTNRDDPADSFHDKSLVVSAGKVSADAIKPYNDAGVYFISQIPTYDITIDFNKINDYLPILTDWTLEVEEECPWAKKMFNVSGIGEGIVFVPKGEFANDTSFWFKSKGLKHKGNDKTKAPRGLSVDPEKLANVEAFIGVALPNWRLEQGLDYLREQGLELIPQNTGAYLKWIANDILKEESDVLVASNLEWKAVAGEVAKSARAFYMSHLTSNFQSNLKVV